MTLSAVTGSSNEINCREAARLAAQQALKSLGAARPETAILFFADACNPTEVMEGLHSVLGDLPVWGAGTTAPITAERNSRVVIGLLSGVQGPVETSWLGHFAQDSIGAALALGEKITQASNAGAHTVLFVVDGLQGNTQPLCAAFEEATLAVNGFMSAGMQSQGKTYQVSNGQCGSGGLAFLWLGGKTRVGFGIGHGWKDSGLHFRVTRSRDVWVQKLNEISPAEVYEQVFGYPAREWAFAPLSDLVRIYSLGVDETGAGEVVLHAPLRMEVDGGLRLNLPIEEGQVVRLMVADPEACLAAARRAAREAVQRSQSMRPALAIVLVDQSWQVLFETRRDAVFNAVQAELGRTPVIGAYTLGQFNRSENQKTLQAMNANIQVVVFSEGD